MLRYLHRHDQKEHDDLFNQMFALRARCFYERRGWSVNVVDGKEIDYFDDLNPLYIMVEEGGTLLASLRLLQTTGPHMLADIFPETMSEQPVIRHPLIWESTRFCVDTNAAEGRGVNGVNWATSELLVGLFSMALETGLENIISVYDLYMERILRRAGCSFDRLGEPFAYDGLKTVAGLFEVSQSVVDELIQKQLGDAGRIPAHIVAAMRDNA